MSTDGININLEVIKKAEIRAVDSAKSEAVIEQAYEPAVSAFEVYDENNDDKIDNDELGKALTEIFAGRNKELEAINGARTLFEANKIKPEQLAAQIIYQYGMAFPADSVDEKNDDSSTTPLDELPDHQEDQQERLQQVLLRHPPPLLRGRRAGQPHELPLPHRHHQLHAQDRRRPGLQGYRHVHR